jgi:hypothetical protein
MIGKVMNEFMDELENKIDQYIQTHNVISFKNRKSLFLFNVWRKIMEIFVNIFMKKKYE